MEHITLNFSGTKKLKQKALAGVVGSGDMEALFVPKNTNQLVISIKTSVDGSTQKWKRLFERIEKSSFLPKGELTIHDFGATPGVARLRIEQVFEEASRG